MSSGTAAALFLFPQKKVMWPIWANREITLSTTATKNIDYIVGVDGVTVFRGVAHKLPNASSITAIINDIVADYFSKNNIALSKPTDSVDVVKVVVVAGSTEVFNDYFVNDWSYVLYRAEDGIEAYPINDPICTTFDIRMPLPISLISAGAISFTVSELGDFSVDFNGDFTVTTGDHTQNVIFSSAGTSMISRALSRAGTIDVNYGTSIGQIKYTGIQSCHRYALYYRNAFGGWDALLIRGAVTQSDSYSRKTVRRGQGTTIDWNAYGCIRTRENYLNEVTRSYTLNTGWLTDDEASRMHHLLGSTAVMLFDIEEGIFTPVVITNNECPYKTFKNQGGKMVNYEINVAEAVNIIRR